VGDEKDQTQLGDRKLPDGDYFVCFSVF
jgi:hypothetical protein